MDDEQTKAWLRSVLSPLQEELRETEAQYAIALKRAEGLRLATKGLEWVVEAEALAVEQPQQPPG